MFQVGVSGGGVAMWQTSERWSCRAGWRESLSQKVHVNRTSLMNASWWENPVAVSAAKASAKAFCITTT